MTMQLSVIKQSLTTELADVQAILPKAVSYERFVNCAAVAIANNADLAEADRQSVINSLTLCAKDGLIPDNREAALVIFNTKDKSTNTWVKKAQYMPMIDGVLKRARQSGQIKTIASRPIYQNDKFRAWMDDDGEHIEYEPNFLNRGEMIGAFAYAKMISGEVQFEVMNMDDLNKVKEASKSSSFGPWVDWFDRMSCKAVSHRLCRRLPNSNELIEMLERGQQMEWQKDEQPMRDITPVNDIKAINSALSGAAIEHKPEQAPTDAQAAEFKQRSEQIMMCETMEQLKTEYESAYRWAHGNFPAAIEHLTMAKNERKSQLEAALVINSEEVK